MPIEYRCKLNTQQGGQQKNQQTIHFAIVVVGFIKREKKSVGFFQLLQEGPWVRDEHHFNSRSGAVTLKEIKLDYIFFPVKQIYL